MNMPLWCLKSPPPPFYPLSPPYSSIVIVIARPEPLSFRKILSAPADSWFSWRRRRRLQSPLPSPPVGTASPTWWLVALTRGSHLPTCPAPSETLRSPVLIQANQGWRRYPLVLRDESNKFLPLTNLPNFVRIGILLLEMVLCIQ